MDNFTPDNSIVAQSPFSVDPGLQPSAPSTPQPNRVAIHLSEKLVHNFTGKNGVEYTTISIPPRDGSDDWGQIAVPKNTVHPDKNGHGFYTYLSADAQFTVQVQHQTGIDEATQKKTYETETIKMTGQEIADSFVLGRDQNKQQDTQFVSFSFPTQFVGKPFEKDGKKLVAVSVPPKADGEKWGTFVVDANRVHQNEGRASSYVTFREDAEISVKTPGDYIGLDDETGKKKYSDPTFEKLAVLDLKARFNSQELTQENSIAKQLRAQLEAKAVPHSIPQQISR